MTNDERPRTTGDGRRPITNDPRPMTRTGLPVNYNRFRTTNDDWRVLDYQ
ncbi:MAG: hypothetical protein AVDCRST_MAG26-1038 [uncultured Chloroflexia bacterium]|uniref:Uncharacterized protein n=1 Tax=uncultured Chloroflexia bacterium TaxID=1672391 RepID=A0A6J4HT21_9CHLR|nr:MAG: hypothetical protein AVDCRST_MAG26-1038 [uncultured Chloroflexia bacterium]